ncbi:hypothetical protein [Streptococcus pantholopis]|uniref:hypothetical protein n=1 Tax=Streptococcus pantholopis TaxID=1811193 RepID=UPI001314A649|nr:hypothetical protein [Streptococcus pantholopis]
MKWSIKGSINLEIRARSPYHLKSIAYMRGSCSRLKALLSWQEYADEIKDFWLEEIKE